MLSYPDKRGRYAGKMSADFSPGSARGDNPVQHPEPVTTLASRIPREAFRVKTTEDPALLQAQAEKEALAKKVAEDAQKGMSSGFKDGDPSRIDLSVSSASGEYHSILGADLSASTTPRISATEVVGPSTIGDVMGGSEG